MRGKLSAEGGKEGAFLSVDTRTAITDKYGQTGLYSPLFSLAPSPSLFVFGLLTV